MHPLLEGRVGRSLGGAERARCSSPPAARAEAAKRRARRRRCRRSRHDGGVTRQTWSRDSRCAEHRRAAERGRAVSALVPAASSDAGRRGRRGARRRRWSRRSTPARCEDQKRQAPAAWRRPGRRSKTRELNLARNERLFERGIAAGKEVEDARAQQAAAAGGRRTGRGGARHRPAAGDAHKVTSPIAGQVVKRLVERRRAGGRHAGAAAPRGGEPRRAWNSRPTCPPSTWAACASARRRRSRPTRSRIRRSRPGGRDRPRGRSGHEHRPGAHPRHEPARAAEGRHVRAGARRDRRSEGRAHRAARPR